MNYYNRHSKNSQKTMIECMRMNGDGKPCNGIDFSVEKDQWLLDPEASFRTLRLRCKKCGKVHVRSFDIKSYAEQFEG